MKRLIKINKKENVLKQLKDDLKGEYDAIELYNKHIDSIDIVEIKNKLIEIRDEELHHSQELKELISQYNNI